MTWDTFLNQLQAWLERRGLLVAKARWVIGLSGGPDSTVLLHAMHDLSERAELGWTLSPAHLHHGLRGEEADADVAFCSNLADSLKLSFFVERADIPADVARHGGSTEEVARTRRYEFLERVALKTGSELVAVAHHADDNAETVLHRICRGTGLRGLAGIHEVRPIHEDSHIRVVRPLLHQRRATIEEICQTRNIAVRIDSTNHSDEFTRGRIRHKVMPLLAEMLNPQVTDALLRLSEHARWLGTYLEDAAERTFNTLVVSEGAHRVTLNTRALLGKQRIIQAEIIRRAIGLVNSNVQDVGFHHVDAILRVAEGTASGKEVHVPGPVVVRKQYERLEFRPLQQEDPTPELGSVFVVCPGRTPLPMLRTHLVAEVCDVDPGKVEELRQKTDRNEEWLDYDQVQLPLLVRGRQEGDRFHPLGAPGAKTIGDFFSDVKVDPEQRARTGILCDQNGPIWVMPLRIDERVKLRPESRRALRLVLETQSAHTSNTP